MRAARTVILVVSLTGLACGSGATTTGSGGRPGTGGGPNATGGAQAPGTGGQATGGGSGGSSNGTGGSASTGGAGMDTGGASNSGGAPASGGAVGSGGRTGGAGVGGSSGGNLGTAGRSSGGTSGTGGAGGAVPFTWSTGKPCPLARFEANGVVVGAELWVMGGFTSSSLTVSRRIDIYDPETDTWRRALDLPGAETHMALAKIGDEIIVAGGFPGAFSPRPPPTTAVWRYSIAGAAWTTGPPLPKAGSAFAFATIGTELHLAGGLAPDGDADADIHYFWDVAGAANWTTAARFPSPRNHGGGTAAGGVFYAIAGRHRWDETAGDVADVNAFDPKTGAWTTRAPIPSARSEIGASTSTLADGRILVIGGSLPGIMPSSDVFVYDPAANSWSTLRALPEKRKGAVAAQIGRRIIVTTGSPTSTDPSASTFIGCCL